MICLKRKNFIKPALISQLSLLLVLNLIYFGASAQCTSGYSSGDLTISGSCTINSDITITGNLKFSSDATLVIDPGVIVTVTGDFDTGVWPYGTHTISGGGAIDIAGRFYNNISGVNSLTISNMTITVGNNGGASESKNEYGSTLNLENGTTFTVTDGDFVNGGDAELTIDNSTMVISSGNYKNDSGATTTVQNDGSLIVSDGELVTKGGSHLTVDNSTVNVSGNFNNSFQALLDVVNNSTFTIGGNFDNGYDSGWAVNEGYVNVNGSAIDVGGNFNNAFSSNMDIDGGGTVTVTNDVNNLLGGTIGVPNGALVVGGTINNNGTINATCSPSCCGGGCATLPVTLVDFDYYMLDNHVVLDWTTVAEINNDYFTVEKSFTGKSFSEADLINGSGTSNIPKEYFWEDTAPLQELTYYRLKQTDFDGTTKYLGIISVSIADLNYPVSVYPNPVLQGSTLKVSGAGLKSWTLRPINGTTLKDGTFSKTQEISTSDLRKGIYILTIETETGYLNKKIVVR